MFKKNNDQFNKMIVSVPDKWLSQNDISIPFNDELHIWLMNLDDLTIDFDQEFTKLSLHDQERLQNIENPAQKESMTNRFIILAKILSYYLKKAPSEVTLAKGERGKPYIENSNIEFNFSHSFNYLVVGVTMGIEIGVDVEKIRSNVTFERLVERYFTKKEVEFYKALPVQKQEVFFFDLWTLKEAVVKTSGLGLKIPFNTFEFPLEPDIERVKVNYRDLSKEYIVYKCLVTNDTSITISLDKKVDKIKYFRL